MMLSQQNPGVLEPLRLTREGLKRLTTRSYYFSRVARKNDGLIEMRL
jgi:hypothetical protein